MFPVLRHAWFDSGYIFASVYEVLSEKGVDMPVVMLDSLVQTVLETRLRMCLSVVQRQLLGQVVQKAVPGAAVAVQRQVRRHPGHGAESRCPWFSLFGRP